MDEAIHYHALLEQFLSQDARERVEMDVCHRDLAEIFVPPESENAMPDGKA